MSAPHLYLDELISCGDEPYTRAAIMADMQARAHPKLLIDRWLQGQQFAARLRARRENLQSRILITKPRLLKPKTIGI